MPFVIDDIAVEAAEVGSEIGELAEKVGPALEDEIKKEFSPDKFHPGNDSSPRIAQEAPNRNDLNPHGNSSLDDSPLSEKSGDNPKSLGPEKNDLDIKTMINNYLADLCQYSEYPETLSDSAFSVKDIIIRSPEDNMRMREDFVTRKTELKKLWEEKYGTEWPKYKDDVYSSNGHLIRRAGSDYDAHHKQPLELGGRNEVDNITPLRAENHYDKQGVHSPNSPYSQLVNALK